MVVHNPPSSADSARPPVIPLPVALYVSNELILELYDGGTAARRFSIRWERFVPGKTTSHRQPRRVPRRANAHAKISARLR
jgi:hypothetical protein